MTVPAAWAATLFLLSLSIICWSTSAARAAPLLPDLIAWAGSSGSLQFMYGGFIDKNFVPGKVVYRFTGALPNVGAGPLEVREVTHADGTQDVYQRIYDSAGGNPSETLIGSFPNAASIPPRHLWLPGIAQYKLRQVTANGGVGDVLTSNDKTSMAVVDSAAYQPPPPGAPPAPHYTNVAADILGISIGYADVYGISFAGQWADASGLASGTYWLEVTVNPYGATPEGRIIESNYSNNSTRILVDLLPGDYNNDGVVDAADYTVWRDTIGQSVTILTTGADGDGDGKITMADYQVWSAHFGNTLSSGAGASANSAVPEPATLWMLLAGILTLCSRRRAPVSQTRVTVRRAVNRPFLSDLTAHNSLPASCSTITPGSNKIPISIASPQRDQIRVFLDAGAVPR
jgi:hypothetical protein